MKLVIVLACLLAVAFATELEVAESGRGGWGWGHGGRGSWGGHRGSWGGHRGSWGHSRKGRSVETEVAQDLDTDDHWNRNWVDRNCASCWNTNWGRWNGWNKWGHSGRWGHSRWSRSVDQDAEESGRWGSHGGRWGGRGHWGGRGSWGGRSHGSWGKSWGRHH